MLASPILCAIVVFGLGSWNARVDAAPLVVVRDAPNQPSSASPVIVTDKDRETDKNPGGFPNSGGRDVPIHVPEPATLILTGIGLAGLIARHARRALTTRS